jgi:hypothetical protein
MFKDRVGKGGDGGKLGRRGWRTHGDGCGEEDAGVEGIGPRALGFFGKVKRFGC